MTLYSTENKTSDSVLISLNTNNEESENISKKHPSPAQELSAKY